MPTHLPLPIADARAARTFLPADFELTTWEALQPYYDALLADIPDNLAALETWLRQRNELDSMVGESQARRYIRMTCDTQNESHKQAYLYFIQEILPHLSLYTDKLNQQFVSHPAVGQLDPALYKTFVRSRQRELELFREANVPLRTEDAELAQQFSACAGAMTIEHEGATLTMQQAGKLLESRDRHLRQSVWEKMAARRAQDRDTLNGILDQQIKLRHLVALNAGYTGFTAYKFDELGRFDYTPDDTRSFHEAVAEVVTPMYERLLEARRQALGVTRLRPWDMSVDVLGEEPLKPFQTGRELIDRSVAVLDRLDPRLGVMLYTMDHIGNLDVESRNGKAPGGYNYPLPETGVPFIFMNATGTQSDVSTMLHEGGHAIHSFVTRGLPLEDLRQTPSEVAELASMSMELMAMDAYDLFYADPKACTRARLQQVEGCILTLPWIATVDAFQQWMYDHPDHTHEARREAWRTCYYRFQGTAVDWTGYEDVLDHLWQKQLHIFEVPFYYIEYGIAQLGALAIWQNFRQAPRQALSQYLAALELGYTRTIPEIYATAGIEFNFSAAYIRRCMEFCLEEYRHLQETVHT
ncbi:MAG: M3 family oligoendopeptidase [Bacteroidia bacterium]|nr:M3 family oligoendopeptidase [Bacteroidia bacterium]